MKQNACYFWNYAQNQWIKDNNSLIGTKEPVACSPRTAGNWGNNCSYQIDFILVMNLIASAGFFDPNPTAHFRR
jgi:hypothetical protein